MYEFNIALEEELRRQAKMIAGLDRLPGRSGCTCHAARPSHKAQGSHVGMSRSWNDLPQLATIRALA